MYITCILIIFFIYIFFTGHSGFGILNPNVRRKRDGKIKKMFWERINTIPSLIFRTYQQSLSTDQQQYPNQLIDKAKGCSWILNNLKVFFPGFSDRNITPSFTPGFPQFIQRDDCSIQQIEQLNYMVIKATFEEIV